MNLEKGEFGKEINLGKDKICQGSDSDKGINLGKEQ